MDNRRVQLGSHAFLSNFTLLTWMRSSEANGGRPRFFGTKPAVATLFTWGTAPSTDSSKPWRLNGRKTRCFCGVPTNKKFARIEFLRLTGRASASRGRCVSFVTSRSRTRMCANFLPQPERRETTQFKAALAVLVLSFHSLWRYFSLDIGVENLDHGPSENLSSFSYEGITRCVCFCLQPKREKGRRK
jgi:hypothetical protein